MSGRVHMLLGRPKVREKDAFLATIGDLQDEYGCVIQALDAEMVVNEMHVTSAAKKALRAFAEDRNVAKDLGLEILRYASGQRQIERALSMGISGSTERIALLVIEDGTSPELSGIFELDGQGPTWNPEVVKKTFQISDEEIDAVGEDKIPDLVLERVALVDAYR